MDKRTKKMGQAAARWLQSEANVADIQRALISVSDLQFLLDYVKALEEEPEKTTVDVYLRGDWYVSILKMDLTEEQVGFLSEIGKRTEGVGSNTIEVQEHNPAYPERNWRGHTRVE